MSGKDGDSKSSGGPGGAQRGGRRVGLKVRSEEAVARGVYSNTALVNMNDNEVTLDFLYVPPQSREAFLRARVVVSPRQAKQLQRVLADTVARYEERFGALPEPKPRDPVLH